ncbi:MAG: AraC family transcriptional regulator [Pontixanthobacter sp.]
MDNATPRGGGNDDIRRALTPPALFALDYLAVPADLSDFVTTFYHFRCDERVIEDIQPAAVGHLTLFPYGKGTMRFADGPSDPSHECNLLTPSSVAAPFTMNGPFHAIGAVFTPLGWAALTGLPADEHANRLHAAADWLGEEAGIFGSRLCDDYRHGRRTGAQCAGALGEFITSRLKPVHPRHAALIAATNDWLGGAINPNVETLFASLAYSRRQAQRLVERYFGLPPKALARKYRALRAAMLMSLPRLSDAMDAELAEAFYDQSHMIREIRLFAGRTPARLGDDDSPFLHEMLDPRNLREIRLSARLPDA